tara:strand:+ start:27992 stop:28132 length:141 start_codon:yes stop_codon:yes gene_type:complete
MSDKSELYYRIYKRQGLIEARKRIEADVRIMTLKTKYVPIEVAKGK